MRRFAFSPLTVILALALVTTAPQQSAPVAAQATPTQQAPIPQPPPPAATADPVKIPLNLFKVPEGLEVTLWAATPLLRNPTNIDIDRDGRIWVAEGVRYRSHHARQPEGDKIVVLQDNDGDGKADSSHTFVQEPALIAPLGVSVIDNKIVVAQPPDLIVYTDVDRNLRFDPAVDKREVLLTGFHGHQPRPLAPLGDGRPGRQVGVQRRQHRRDVHGQVGQDVPHLRRRIGTARSVRSSIRTTPRRTPASRATTGTSTSAASRSG